MTKRRTSWAHGALALILSVFIGSAGHAQVSPLLSQKSPDAATIVSAAQQKGYVRVIVEFNAPVSPAQMRPDATFLAPIKAQIAALQNAIIGSHFGSAAPQGFERGLLRFDITPMFAVNVTTSELNGLAADPRVVRIHLDRLSSPFLIQSVPLIGMTNAYSFGATGASQAVAVIDTGVQSNHEFLAGKITMEACFSNSGGAGVGVTLCPNGQSSQTGTGAADPTTAQCLTVSNSLCQHGTHVAGIAAGNNTSQTLGEPTNGVAKSANIVAFQVFTRFNDPAFCGTAPCVLSYTSDQISALNWLYQNALNPATGVKLASANMSLGGGKSSSYCDDDPLKPSIDILKSAGVATVIASGNDGYTNAVSFPGCISTAVTVGATDKQDRIASYSNMASMVDLMAPGGLGGTNSCAFGAYNADILSSVAGAAASQNNLFECHAGTSMAAPHVAGAFAAIRTACSNKTVDQIVTALQSTGVLIYDTRKGGTETKPRIRVDLAVQQLGCGARSIATHDFDGDGKSDILWRDTSGNVAMWLMNAGAVSSSTLIANVTPTWGVVGQRDFNGDGKADILWRDDAGNVAMWLMNGGQVSSSALVGNVPNSWSIAGTGDFNSDDKGDILWRDTSGNVALWLMNGGSIASSVLVANVPTSWSIGGSSRNDIVWRDASGNVALWLMNGGTVSSAVSLGNVSTSWSIVGLGDFNGDNNIDLLWRDTSGNTAIWLLDNSGHVTSSVSVGNVPITWSIAETGDFDGDGKSDILWRDTSGNVAIWFMNGGMVLSGAAVGNVPVVWTIQGANAD